MRYQSTSRFYILYVLCLVLTTCIIYCKGAKKIILKPEENKSILYRLSLLHTLIIDTVKKCPLVNALRLTGIVDFNQDKQVNIYSLSAETFRI